MPEQPARETWVDAWMRSQPADVLDSDGWLGILAKALNGMEDAAYERGRREATEGWEREWGARWMQDAAEPTDVLHPCGSEEAAREMERRSGGYRRAESRLVGPWEPADQPEGSDHG
jgi:hypothetical protein